MKFQDFLQEGKVQETTKGEQQAESLQKMSLQTQQALSEITLTEQNTSIIFSQNYEAFRQIVEAIALKEGFKVYSHEAYTYYLKEKHQENTAKVFDRLRKLRNKINYYGSPVSIAVTQQALKDVKKHIIILKTKFL